MPFTTEDAAILGEFLGMLDSTYENHSVTNLSLLQTINELSAEGQDRLRINLDRLIAIDAAIEALLDKLCCPTKVDGITMRDPEDALAFLQRRAMNYVIRILQLIGPYDSWYAWAARSPFYTTTRIMSRR